MLPIYLHRVLRMQWGNGPLWFAEALLIFSAGFALWRMAGGDGGQREAALPGTGAWFTSALAVGALALLLRQFVPLGHNFAGMQLGFFASYVFLFAVGVMAPRHGWLEKLDWRAIRPAAIMSLLLSPALLITVVVVKSASGTVHVQSGFSLPAIIYAFWEPLVAWGVIAIYLVWFRTYSNGQSQAWRFLARSAYGAYILHAPVLVATATLLRPWQAAAFEKFAATGSLTLLCCSLLSALLLRIPPLRHVL